MSFRKVSVSFPVWLTFFQTVGEGVVFNYTTELQLCLDFRPSMDVTPDDQADLNDTQMVESTSGPEERFETIFGCSEMKFAVGSLHQT
jgi:hypothetical protein